MTTGLLRSEQGTDLVAGGVSPSSKCATCDPESFGREQADPNALPLAHARASVVSLGDCTAVYDETTHALIMLNAAASEIWASCDGTTTFDDLVSAIARRHQVEDSVVHDDVWKTLRQLAGMGLVSDAR